MVGTPGHVMDLALDSVIRFDSLQKLVIDEFDEMLNLGFRTQVTSILSMLKNKRQNILFLATLTDEVDDMLEDYFDFPEEVTLEKSGIAISLIGPNEQEIQIEAEMLMDTIQKYILMLEILKMEYTSTI